MFDVLFYYNFYYVLIGNGNYDMRNILKGMVVVNYFIFVVILVENYDL